MDAVDSARAAWAARTRRCPLQAVVSLRSQETREGAARTSLLDRRSNLLLEWQPGPKHFEFCVAHSLPVAGHPMPVARRVHERVERDVRKGFRNTEHQGHIGEAAPHKYLELPRGPER